MKRLLFILFLLPLIGYGQLNIYDNKLQISSIGDVTYNYIHLVGSADSISVTLSGSGSNIYRVIKGTGITWRDYSNLTGTADSFKILYTGDYIVNIWMSAFTSNANDIIRCKLYTNNLPSVTSMGRFIMTSGGTSTATTPTRYYAWYKMFTANDRVSFRCACQNAARDVIIGDFKIIVYKLPEQN